MKFEYSAAFQRSPEWYKLRIGKVTASRLADWLAVSKRDGKPLKARSDYEQELMFERTFGVSFENFVSSAMQAGIEFENFAKQEYHKATGNEVEDCGCWFNEYFLASPDGTIGKDGLVEVKILKDNSFTDVLVNGVPENHWKQMQGQLWASGRKWNDYVAANLNAKKIKVIRVLPDKEFFKTLEASVKEPISVEPFSKEGVFDIVDKLPEAPTMISSVNNIAEDF